MFQICDFLDYIHLYTITMILALAMYLQATQKKKKAHLHRRAFRQHPKKISYQKRVLGLPICTYFEYQINTFS